MRLPLRPAAGLAGLFLAASAALGQTLVHPVTRAPIRPAPDACGPGFYAANQFGMVYGPNYYVVPPWAPHSGIGPGCLPGGPGGPGGGPAGPGGPNLPPGMLPQPGNAGPAARPMAYPTHPFVRGPRDFFMWYEQLEEQQGRDVRPQIVP